MLKKLLGGRPMRRTSFAFTDVVSGKPVYYFIDRLGRRWLAEHRWARFRISAQNKEL